MKVDYKDIIKALSLLEGEEYTELDRKQGKFEPRYQVDIMSSDEHGRTREVLDEKRFMDKDTAIDYAKRQMKSIKSDYYDVFADIYRISPILNYDTNKYEESFETIAQVMSNGYVEVLESVDKESKKQLDEDTEKQNGKWVNKGKEGAHGTFKTKKEADAQRKAMFANGYKAESLNEAMSNEVKKSFMDEYKKEYERLYKNPSLMNNSSAYDAMDKFDYMLSNDDRLIRELASYRGVAFTSDREVVAFMNTLKKFKSSKNTFTEGAKKPIKETSFNTDAGKINIDMKKLSKHTKEDDKIGEIRNELERIANEVREGNDISWGEVAYLQNHQDIIKKYYPNDVEFWQIAGIPEEEWNDRVIDDWTDDLVECFKK